MTRTPVPPTRPENPGGETPVEDPRRETVDKLRLRRPVSESLWRHRSIPTASPTAVPKAGRRPKVLKARTAVAAGRNPPR